MHGLISNNFLHFHAWIDIQQFLAQPINMLFLKYIIFLLRPALYVMLANIYASAGRWEEVATVRKLMRDNGLKKKPGCSWVEVNKRVHNNESVDVVVTLRVVAMVQVAPVFMAVVMRVVIIVCNSGNDSGDGHGSPPCIRLKGRDALHLELGKKEDESSSSNS
ncbi:hypothetical protein RJ639_019803 [Escallonia herrerae]|uniref:Pentatricopeptide repeat-containing protein n=1 Tax=Escallonia herrerae TaxID=1293975 RepID=A0AA89AIM4_9ASTE|nr:hypothetical protein RJ639_019803 [Escallonia herrerae]